ncbi:AAA family ATPase [Sedimentitalea sp. JM2-8]|uniref:AAA family ATPase n=1 Tax=Sedimentitalea xiamensis TaxID=3050037 RepID=A0ABT7F9G1_9RHOB|nr:AAA family ATPase [Sedimentitalea xiamensis]MDK3071752.1 AAA family ATPase [Sedimentitalea xiamensis]
MYEAFFGLEVLPFKITPDPAFIYWNKGNRRAASILAFGIEQLVPITVVTGEVGTGKTTLLQQFLEDAPTDMTVGLISNFWSGMGGLYQWILNAFDLPSAGSEVELFRRFQDFVVSEYAAGRRCVLIVDEAQNVSDADLEQLRMLTNMNAGKDSLFMLFLVGQPQLRDRLLQPDNRQIAQRVGASFHLGPMSLEDTRNYVRHRIKVAGGTREIFDDEALDLVHKVAGGVPRLTNVVCELAMVTAFGDEVEKIDGPFMEELLAEAEANGMMAHLPLQSDLQPPPPPREVEAEKPKSPARFEPIPFRSPARKGNGHQQIRLISEPENADQDDPANRHERTDPVVAENLADSLPETDRARPAPDDEQVDVLQSVMRAAPHATPVKAAPARESGEVSESSPQADAEAVRPLAEEKPEGPAGRSRLLACLDHGLNAALVSCVVAAVYATIFSLPDAPVASVESAQAAEDFRTVVTPQPESRPVVSIVPLDNPDGSRLLEQALNAGGVEPAAAALAFARAALRDQPRAAYYLGQVFETGNGVARDRALARAWYMLAEEDVRSARRRLEDLAPPENGTNLAPPLPSLGGPVEGGGSEFIWTSGDGADPAFYLVESATAPDATPTKLGMTTLSAMKQDDTGDARVWRVIAANADLGLYSISQWRLMGAAPDPSVQIVTPVVPNITIFDPSGANARLAEALAGTFPGADISAAVNTGETLIQTVVRYFYDKDRDLAERVANQVGDSVSAVRSSAPGTDPPLPGQIHVLLAAP